MAEENNVVSSDNESINYDDFQEDDREPFSWRNYEMAKKTFVHGHSHSLAYLIERIQDILMCFCCQRPLSVAPFFYEKEHPNNKACGRCFRDPASAVHTREMLQDHLYEKLLPHFGFQCTCNAVLMGTQVADHEINCFSQRQSPQPPSKNNRQIHDWPKGNAFYIWIGHSDVKKLCKTLSCDLCNKPLSVFPVISDSERFICGRCEEPGSGKWIEQMIYFDVEQCVEFPCHYANCTSMQMVDKVVEHHNNCRWATKLCPLDCGLLYPLAEMSIHIRRIHLHESVDRIEVKKQSSLFKIEGEPYVVSITAVDEDQQRISCAVFGLDEIEYENLQMEIVDEDSGSVSHQSTVQIARLGQPLLYSTVQIEKNAYLRLVRVEDSVGGLALDEESSQRFECPVCYSYMTRSILKCENGHPICDQCKVKIDESCPMCRGWLPADDRHSKLEKEAEAFKFPCRMQEGNNCNVTLTRELLTKHEVRCKWREVFRSGRGSGRCRFEKCRDVLDSDQYNDFFNHCAQQHFDSLMYTGSKEIFKWSTEAGAAPPPPCNSLLFFDGEVFLVTFHYIKEIGVSLRISYRMFTRRNKVPNLKSYNIIFYLRSNEMNTTAVDKAISMFSLPWRVRLDNKRVNGLVNVGRTFSWLEYQVKLEVA